MTYGEWVNNLNKKVEQKAFKENQWGKRHIKNWNHPGEIESPIVGLVEAWVTYADRHKKRYYSGIGEDGVLGDGWEKIGDGIRTLFNGELGGLDGGTLDHIMCHIFAQEGMEK